MALGALGLVTVYSVLGAGCGGDVKQSCLDACSTLADCGGGAPTDDCASSCDQVADSVDGTDCEGAASAFYDCINDTGCSVDLGKDCQSELADIQSCALQFCAENPKDERCSSSSSDDSSGSGGSSG